LQTLIDEIKRQTTKKNSKKVLTHKTDHVKLELTKVDHRSTNVN